MTTYLLNPHWHVSFLTSGMVYSTTEHMIALQCGRYTLKKHNIKYSPPEQSADASMTVPNPQVVAVDDRRSRATPAVVAMETVITQSHSCSSIILYLHSIVRVYVYVLFLLFICFHVYHAPTADANSSLYFGIVSSSPSS